MTFIMHRRRRRTVRRTVDGVEGVSRIAARLERARAQTAVLEIPERFPPRAIARARERVQERHWTSTRRGGVPRSVTSAARRSHRRRRCARASSLS